MTQVVTQVHEAKDNAFIGLVTFGNGAIWVWTDNSETTYFNWKNNEPSPNVSTLSRSLFSTRCSRCLGLGSAADEYPLRVPVLSFFNC